MGTKKLKYQVEHQEGNSTCWAATVQSIWATFHPLQSKSQCEVISQYLINEMLEIQCCPLLPSSICDFSNRIMPSIRDNMLEDSNTHNGIDEIQISKALTFEQIRNFIDNDQLILAIIRAGNSGVGHVVTIYGYDDVVNENKYYFIGDSLDSSGTVCKVNASDFPQRYRGWEEWTHFVIIKRNSPSSPA